LSHVIPSHLLDRHLFDFQSLTQVGDVEAELDAVVEHQEHPVVTG
jgi:hypothetical protein